MINTIFYFVKTPLEYEQLKNEISARTIVFVEDEKAIYKNGVRYGSLSDSDVREKIVLISGGDSYINLWLERLENIITKEQTRLHDLVNTIDTTIRDKVNLMFNDADWVLSHVADKIVSESNFGLLNVDEYLLRIGMWYYDSDGNKVTLWSKIALNINSLLGEVSALRQYVDGKYTALQSSIELLVDIDNDTASTNITNFVALLNELKQVVEWMYSGLRSSASPTESFADIIAAGYNGIYNAISDLHTYVKKLENGEYVAQSSLLSQIESYISHELATAGITTETTLHDAFSSVFARLNSTDPGTPEGLAELTTRVYLLEQGGYVSEANLISKIVEKMDVNGESLITKLSQSGLATTAAVDYAISSLRSEMSGSTSGSGSSNQQSGYSELEVRVRGLEEGGLIAETNLISKIIEYTTGANGEALISKLSQAGLATSASVNLAINDLSTTLLGVDANTLALLSQAVTDLQNGGYISESNLKNKIVANKDAIISEAGLATTALINALGQTYLATADLTTALSNLSGLQITSAGLALYSDLYAANSEITAIKNNPSSNILGWSQLATKSYVDERTGETISETELVSKLSNLTDAQISAAGFLSKAKLDSAVAGLFAENSDVKAQVELVVRDKTSNLLIDTNTIDARVNEVLISGSAEIKGNVSATLFIAGYNNDLQIVTGAGRLSFINNGSSVGYFNVEDGGLLLYLLHDGNWYKVDFTKWLNGDGTTQDAYARVLGSSLTTSSELTDSSTSIPSFTTMSTLFYNNITAGDGLLYYKNGNSYSLFSGTIYSVSSNGVDLQLLNKITGSKRIGKKWSKTSDDYVPMYSSNFYNVAAITEYEIWKYTYSNGQLTSYKRYVYSPNYVTSYTINSSTLKPATITRGAKWIKGANEEYIGSSDYTAWENDAKFFYTFVNTDGKVYDVYYPDKVANYQYGGLADGTNGGVTDIGGTTWSVSNAGSSGYGHGNAPSRMTYSYDL